MRIVIKFAGALLERPLEPMVEQVAALAHAGHELLVVHGGGRTFTATLERLGLPSRFIGGLRSTDAETRDVAVMVLGGLLNKRLAAAISDAGQPAVGLAGGDAGCFRARPLRSPRGLGFVGELSGVRAEFLEVLWQAGVVPVTACLALGPANEIYNINADQMASAAAEYLRADRLIYLTDVPGVLDGECTVEALDCEDLEGMIATGRASGGMVLKLRAAQRALEAGVDEVRIVGGEIPGSLLAAVEGQRVGTQVLAQVAAES